MKGGLIELSWWEENCHELPEPSGSFTDYSVAPVRFSGFACPAPNECDSKRGPCGANMQEYAGILVEPDGELKRCLVCPVCGYRTKRSLGKIIVE